MNAVLFLLSSVAFADVVQGFYNKTLIHNITQLLNTLLDNQNKNFRPYHGGTSINCSR